MITQYMLKEWISPSEAHDLAELLAVTPAAEIPEGSRDAVLEYLRAAIPNQEMYAATRAKLEELAIQLRDYA